MAEYSSAQNITKHTVQESVSNVVKLVIIVIGMNIMSDMHLIMK
jgi:hypothetical protein